MKQIVKPYGKNVWEKKGEKKVWYLLGQLLLRDEICQDDLSDDEPHSNLYTSVPSKNVLLW